MGGEERKERAPARRPSTAAILVIGNEILSGKVDEANVAVLARELRALGILLERVVVVLDDVDTIAKEVTHLAGAHDWLFTSGGVGPTHDDVAIEAVAKASAVAVVSPPELGTLPHAQPQADSPDGHLQMSLV